MKPIYPDNLSDPMSDENLVLLTLAGDTSAYDRLVLRWETAVVNAALSVCRNRTAIATNATKRWRIS